MNRTQAKWLIENWDMVVGMELSNALSLNFDPSNKSMIEAYANGQVVEWRLRETDEWQAGDNIGFGRGPHLYRIRPEEKYVEFDWSDICREIERSRRVVDGCGEAGTLTALRYPGFWQVEIRYDAVGTVYVTPRIMLQWLKFLDTGKPCGKLVTH